MVERAEPVQFLRFDTRSLEFQVRQVARVIEENGIELLHGHPSIALIHTALAASITDKPFVVTFHGPPVAAELTAHFGVFYMEVLRRRVLPRASEITVVSEWACEVLLRDYVVDEQRVRVVRNPIDFENTAAVAGANGRLGLLVSRFDADRRTSCLAALRLFAELKNQDSSWRFRGLGDGAAEEELRAAATALGLREMEWLGAVTNVQAHYAECTFAAGLGRVVLECASFGKPCVVAGYEGLAGVLDGINFRSLQYRNFTAQHWPLMEPAEAAQSLTRALKSGSGEDLREMVRHHHDALITMGGYRKAYDRALGEGVAGGDPEGEQAALRWLTSVPNLPLREMDWWWSGATLPEAFLGRPAEWASWTEVRRQHLLQTQLLAAREAAVSRQEREADQLRRELGEARAEVESIRAASGAAQEHHLRERAVEAARTQELETRISRLEVQAVEQAATEQMARDRAAGMETRSAQFEEALLEEAARSHAARLQTGAAVRGYQAEFERQLAEYRNQRAWQVMLLARMVYTHLAREGWRGWKRMIASVARALFGGKLPLSHYDLRFPSIWDHVPDELTRPGSLQYTAGGNSLGACPQLAAHRYDMIVFPVFDFEFRFQRPQQIAVQCASEGHRVFWVSPGRLLPADSPELFQMLPIRENVWEVRLRRPQFDIYGGNLDARTEDQCTEALKTLCEKTGISELAVLVQFPFWGPLAMGLAKRGCARIIYDLMDDWGHWPVEPKIGQFALDQEMELLRKCDVLTVTGEHFRRRHESNSPAPLLVRNGADFNFFQSASAHESMDAVARPVVGYYGAISAWFDVELVAEVAKSRPLVSFVLVGQVHDADIRQLEALPNVQLLGERHYREIPSYLAAFDVCLLPFRLTELTRGVDPVKVYEYLSQGKPVVATAMEELAQFQDLIYTRPDAVSFGMAIDAAMQENDADLRARRIAFAQNNSWAVRWSAMDHAIGRMYSRVSILVVTYQSAPYLRAFHDALMRNTSYPNYEVIYVDNASSDGSAEMLRRIAAGDERVRVELSSVNLGFAGGNNAAAAMASGDTLVLLNPDVLVTGGWLGRLVGLLERDDRLGMTAPVTNFSGNETKIDFDYRNQVQMEEFARRIATERAGQSRPLGMAPLLCAAIPRKVWDETGGLDERFQVGMFEDDDLSLRIRRAGYEVATAEDCFVHHFGNGSFSTLPSQESESIFQQNRKEFERKWGVVWQPHRLRPGVRSLAIEPSFKPAGFVGGGSNAAGRKPAAPVLLRLLPATARAGHPVNVQADGTSALAIECLHATPGTSASLDGSLISTTFGTERFLSAQLPLAIFESSGVHLIRLLNDNGESSVLKFEVLPDA